MLDVIKFDNDIHYMVVTPTGILGQEGWVKNAVGYRLKDQISKMLTTPSGDSPGTLGQINLAYYRLDGTQSLGTAGVYVASDSSTVYSTRYNSGTYINSVMFSATYTATANVTCKVVALNNIAMSGASDVGSFCAFYSTNINMGVGSGGKIILQWTVNTY